MKMNFRTLCPIARLFRLNQYSRSNPRSHPNPNPCVLTTYRILPATIIDVPYLFIQSLQDAFLPPSMSEGMERFLPQLRRREVDATHFSHMLAPEVVNEHIREWLNEEVFPRGDASAPK